MQKTTKNLLTKIFALLTVIFCVFALALGAIGCAKEETKAVAKVSVNGNVLTVTYLDGTTDNLTVEGEKYVECGHDSYVSLMGDEEAQYMVPYYAEDEEIRSDICYVSLKACTVCNHIYAEYGKHVLGAKDATGKFVEGATTEVAATCTEEGYKGQICKNPNCKYIEGEILPIVDHDFTEFKLVVDTKNFDKCTQVWFDGKQVCNDCGLTQLIVNQPTGHKFENIRVGVKATTTTAATLIADCDQCGKTGLLVKELYKLGTEEAAANYDKAIVDHFVGYHTATYTYEYEGETYVVADNFPENHTTEINDYTKEAYPEINFKSGETLSCHKYADAVYICEECDTAVDVRVKKAHTVSEDAKYASTTADCEKAGVETYICEVEACKAEVKVEVDAYGHNFAKLVEDSLVENEDGSINVTFACTNEFSGVKCTETEELKNIKNFEKKDANCEEDGYIKYTTEDGQEAELILKADGKHVLEGYDKTVEEDTELKYEDVKAIAGVKYKSGSPATCGAKANAIFVCKVCDSAIDVTVARNHVEINITDVVEADCTNPGSYKFNCAYEDCEYHAENNKLNGVIETVGHQLSYVANSVNATAKTIKVTCAVENCPFHAETVATYDSIIEERSMTCGDYAEGKTNSNTYTKVVLPGETDEYTVVEAIDNDIHVLNGEKVKEGSIFPVGTPGIKKFSGELANCKVKADAIFVCEECDCAIDVQLKGLCTTPADLAAATKTDDIDCEKAAYNYWICADCGERHDLDKVAEATGHNFTYTITAGVATVTCAHEATDCACGAEECNDCAVTFTVVLADVKEENIEVITTCEDKTTIYTVLYKSADVEGYTQEVEIKVVEQTGSHKFLKDANGNNLICKYVERDSDNEIVREGWGYFCTECAQYFIQAWDIPGARPWVSGN